MYTSEVHIGKNVFIGRGTYIKAGVQIGDNAFIEEYSVVLSDIEENSIASGNPCTKKYNIDRFDETFYDEDKKIKWDEIKKEEDVASIATSSFYSFEVFSTSRKHCLLFNLNNK